MTRYTLRSPFLLAGTALAIASCNRTEAPAAAAAAVPTQAEATAIVDGAEAQWNSGDAARIMALYKDGAVMFDVAAPAPSDDRATQTRWTEAFAAMRLTGFRAPDRPREQPEPKRARGIVWLCRVPRGGASRRCHDPALSRCPRPCIRTPILG